MNGNDSRFVAHEEYRLMLAIQFSQFQQLLNHIMALEDALLEQGILRADLMVAALDRVGQSEQAQKVHEAIAKLRGDSSIEDILKDFEGPIQ